MNWPVPRIGWPLGRWPAVRRPGVMRTAFRSPGYSTTNRARDRALCAHARTDQTDGNGRRPTRLPARGRLCPRRPEQPRAAAAGRFAHAGPGQLHPGQAAHPQGEHLHVRHRRAGLRAVVRQRRPGQRQRLRVRGRLCDRRPNSATGTARSPGRRVTVQRGHPARPEDLRRRPGRVLDHRGPAQGGRLLQPVLRRHPGRDHRASSPGGIREVDRDAEPVQVRRPGRQRPATTRREGAQAEPAGRRRTTTTTTPSRRWPTARSRRWWWTCRPRSRSPARARCPTR